MKVRSTVWMSIARRAHFSLWRVQSRSWSSWRRERRWLSSLRTWCCRSTLLGLRAEHRNLWRYNRIIKMDVMPFAYDSDTLMQLISFRYGFNFSLVGGDLCSFPSSSWQVKLSSKSGQNIDIVWTENGLLITATGEHVVRSVCWCHLLTFKLSAELLYLSFNPFSFRLWDLERDDNYVLPLDETLGFEKGEMINCVSYCAAKGYLLFTSLVAYVHL